MTDKVIVPRSFKLLDELEKAEKGEAVPYPHTGLISLGLTDGNDITLTTWNASIIGPQGTSVADRFFSLRVVTDETYPKQAPKIWFLSKIVLPFVDKKTGEVNVKSLGRWDRNTCGIISTLCAIRTQMKYCSKYAQPKEGEMF